MHLLKFGRFLLMKAHLLPRRTGSPEGHQSLLKAGAVFPAGGSGPSLWGDLLLPPQALAGVVHQKLPALQK